MRYKYTFKLVGFGKYEEIKEEIKEPREVGFYWVKFEGKWTIAEWLGERWYFLGDIGAMKDSFFDKIHEEILKEPVY